MSRKPGAVAWVPQKYRTEASEILALTADPWSDPPPFVLHKGEMVPVRARPSKDEDLCSHWEWILQREHFAEWDDLTLKTRVCPEHAKPFWRTLEECKTLRQLCAERPSRALHAVIVFLYQNIFRPAAAPGHARRRDLWGGGQKRIRAQMQRYWQRVQGEIHESIELVQRIPEAILSPQDREQLAALLGAVHKRAEELAKNPPAPSVRVRMVQIAEAGEQTYLSVESPQEWNTAGRPAGGTADLNVDLAVLVDLVRQATKGRRHWRIAAELLRHFYPREFLTSFEEEQLKGRIKQHARRTTKAATEIKRRKTSFLEHTIRLQFPYPDFLPADPR